MKMRFLIFVLVLLFATAMQAQISRSELTKQTSKGISLIEDGKLEDAISIFNDILTKDPTEGKALLLRARTKFQLGAYKGAKKDCFAYMDIYGIDAEVAGLLGKTEKSMENYKQALAYLKTALLFDSEGLEYLMDRADIFYNLGLDDQACEDWYAAALVGSEEARDLMKRNCKQFLKKEKEQNNRKKEDKKKQDDYTKNESRDEDDQSSKEEDEEEVVTSNEDEEEMPDSSGEESEEEVDEDDEPVMEDSDVDEEEEESEETYPIDDKIEEIFIDDELTIIIADGIGSRKLIEKPDILILSDKSGEVVVNICVDRLGRVVNPSVNDEASTITTPALISLALRESSNFRFARSSRRSHCGTITYVITGSE